MLQKSFRWGFPLLLFLLTQLSCDSSRLTLIIEATGVRFSSIPRRSKSRRFWFLITPSGSLSRCRWSQGASATYK